jgi:hypothetical protein
MILNKEDFLKDLLPFCDIGAAPPKISEKQGVLTASITRDGRDIKISQDHGNGRIAFQKKGFPVKGFSSFGVMLASDDFANLKKWAETQADLLRRIAVDGGKLIPINGRTHVGDRVENISHVDRLIGVELRKADATEVLLIDGPAGIGKTNLVEQLALYRAEKYKTSAGSLILHVRSRGRVLSNLQDLMAFSLQTIRSNTTYDQVPVLLKHGLIVVAVDGFDELGDPNGYDLAWAQVNDLISAARGAGTVILSGRDTFLGRSRLFRDVQSLRNDLDLVVGLTLDSPSPEQASDWLKARGWADVHLQIPAVASLLEEGSFALRPVFLNLMSTNLEPKKLRDQSDSFLTPLLVQHMLQREAGLFGSNVEAVIKKPDIENFLLRFLIEVARDMADSQSEALDDTTLAWLVELALGDGVSDEIVRLIRNRAGVVAALKPDVRQGYKNFIHSHLQSYFLSLSIVESVGQGELPKYLKRNVLGSELLTVFGDVAAKAAEARTPQMEAFIKRAISLASVYGGADRAGRNIGGLVLAILAILPDDSELIDCEIDEAVVRGTASKISLSRVSVQQMDCRGADLSAVNFVDCGVGSLIANDATRLSPTFPTPSQITIESEEGIFSQEQIQDWLNRHGRNPNSTVATGLASPELAVHGIYKLLGRACRVRQYWLRLGEDLQADKILRDRYWGDLSDILRSCNLLREETRQASGSNSLFTHIKMREKILLEDNSDLEIEELYRLLNQRALAR